MEAAVDMWGTVYEYPFPDVPVEWEAEKINRAAADIVHAIAEMAPDAVLCQGEMCMTTALVRLFQENQIPVYAAVSCRQSVEALKPDGTVEKKSIFDFIKFRRYERVC